VDETACGIGGGEFPGYKALPAKEKRRSTNSLDLSIVFDAVLLKAKATELLPRMLELNRAV